MDACETYDVLADCPDFSKLSDQITISDIIHAFELSHGEIKELYSS